MKLTSVKTDPIKVEQGVWIDDIPDFPGVRLKVRPASNPDYRRLYGQLVERTPRNLKRGGVISDYETKVRLNAICLADTVLIDWDGFEDETGKPLPYSAGLAKERLLDPEYVAFRDAVSWACNVAEDDVRLDAEANAGNFKRSSGGSSTGATD